MGLRINTNPNAVTALRNLSQSDRALSKSLERLSTGLRINRASDDPSGLVISEQLRAEVASLRQAVENSEFASNLIGTAEAALNEVSSLLIKIRESAIFALNTGGTSREQVAAEQDGVDSVLASIDRISRTTRFASNHLLNGTAGFNITTMDAGIAELNPISVTFSPTSSTTTFALNVTSAATQASVSGAGVTGISASGGSVRLRLTGALGTEDIILASGASLADFTAAVNLIRSNTGVYASGSRVYSENFGTNGTIAIKQVGGTGAFTGASGAITGVGLSISSGGTNAVANIDGASISADGNLLTVTSSVYSGTMTLENSFSPTGGYPTTLNFSIANSGLLFQLNTEPTAGDQEIIGLPNISTSFLGREKTTTGGFTTGGFLEEIRSGGASDLFTDAGNSVRIVDAAINKISDVRAYLGAFVADTVEPNIVSLNVAIENLVASESEIRDLDFAMETAEFTRTQVLFQAGVSVLASANTVPQSVLQLLG